MDVGFYDMDKDVPRIGGLTWKQIVDAIQTRPTVEVWPVAGPALGYRSKSAAYDAARKGLIRTIPQGRKMPVPTISAKIDVAYAFKLFDEDLYNDFRAIKDIRNKFAHTRDLNLHFNSSELAPEVQKLTGWTNKSDPEQLFNQRVHACVKALQPHINRSAIVNALKKDRAPQSIHPDQSQS
jgi:hypothetical protein